MWKIEIANVNAGQFSIAYDPLWLGHSDAAQTMIFHSTPVLFANLESFGAYEEQNSTCVQLDRGE